jgi:glycosyltransferase involved in cell wall biosynthesis
LVSPGGGEVKNADVSVVIPVYNGERYLAEAVRSVLNQSLAPAEIIVVDDGSTDGSGPMAQKLAAEYPLVRVISQPNAGVGAARNKGAAESTGAWLAFLDSDDLWLPNKLELQSQSIALDAACVVIGGPMQYTSGVGSLNACVGESNLEHVQEAIRAAKLMPFPISSAVVKREAFECVGGFDTTLHRSVPGLVEDIDLIARLASLGTVRTVPSLVGSYRLHEGSASNRHFFSQRQGVRFVRARLEAERIGTELSWEEFQSKGISFRQRRDDIVMYFFRQSGLRWALGKRLTAIASILPATILGPHYTLNRIYAKRRNDLAP